MKNDWCRPFKRLGTYTIAKRKSTTPAVKSMAAKRRESNARLVEGRVSHVRRPTITYTGARSTVSGGGCSSR